MKEFGIIYDSPNLKVERFPEQVLISLSVGGDTRARLLSSLSREQARELGRLLLDDAEHRGPYSKLHPGSDESFADQCEAEGSLMP